MHDRTARVSEDVALRQRDRYRAMSPTEKLSQADSLWDVVWSATKAGIRMRHPDFDSLQVEHAARMQLRSATD